MPPKRVGGAATPAVTPPLVEEKETYNNNNIHWKPVGGKFVNSRKARALHTKSLKKFYGRDPSTVDREDLTVGSIWHHLPAGVENGYSFAAEAESRNCGNFNTKEQESNTSGDLQEISPREIQGVAITQAKPTPKTPPPPTRSQPKAMKASRGKPRVLESGDHLYTPPQKISK